MPRIPATLAELSTSAERMSKDAAVTSGDTSLLLTFYAVECIMKATFLKSAKLPPGQSPDTSYIKKEFGSGGHDLHGAFKTLAVPASVASPPAFTVVGRTPGQASMNQAHQLWRYGIANTPKTDPKVWLDAVFNYFKSIP